MRFYHKDDQQMQVKNHSSRHRILAPISVLLILALAASLFHYKELEISQVKDYLAEKGVSVRR